MHVLLLIILLLVIFSYIGFRYQFNISKHKIELNQLKLFENHIIDVINHSGSFNNVSYSLLMRGIYDIVNNRVSNISFLPPIDGFVTQSIDKSKQHNGIDIAAELGEPILASNDGIVVFSSINGDLGNTIIISHPYNYFTVYGHCDSLFIKEREKIIKGDIVGTVGKTGKATAPHLHFEIWYNDSIIDPRNIINKYGDLDVSSE